MANKDKEDAQLQEQNLELRIAISDAYSAIEGYKAVQSFSALTFEELANAQILRIAGPDTQERPNELNRIKRVLDKVTQAVAKIKSMPPEAFQKSDPERDVNTPA